MFVGPTRLASLYLGGNRIVTVDCGWTNRLTSLNRIQFGGNPSSCDRFGESQPPRPPNPLNPDITPPHGRAVSPSPLPFRLFVSWSDVWNCQEAGRLNCGTLTFGTGRKHAVNAMLVYFTDGFRIPRVLSHVQARTVTSPAPASRSVRAGPTPAMTHTSTRQRSARRRMPQPQIWRSRTTVQRRSPAPRR